MATKRLVGTSLPLLSPLYGSRCALCGVVQSKLPIASRAAAYSNSSGTNTKEVSVGQGEIRGRGRLSTSKEGKMRRYATSEAKKAAGPDPSFTKSPATFKSPNTGQRAEGPRSALGRSQDQQLKSGLRRLLREVAQPVAVVTSFMPSEHGICVGHSTRRPLHSHHHSHARERQAFHGATLSSFSSIAMDPHPLVAFALRVPSRMAATLSSFAPASLTSHHPSSSIPPNTSSQSHGLNTHLVLNILSDSQHPLAQAFSRPDLHPHPFASVPYTLTVDGLPILDGSLGALACKVVGRVKLSEVGMEEGEEHVSHGDGLGGHSSGNVVSELFIARVVRVEVVPKSNGVVAESLEPGHGDDALSPLLYWRRRYTSCRGL